jgi:hypothetical protein
MWSAGANRRVRRQYSQVYSRHSVVVRRPPSRFQVLHPDAHTVRYIPLCILIRLRLHRLRLHRLRTSWLVTLLNVSDTRKHLGNLLFLSSLSLACRASSGRAPRSTPVPIHSAARIRQLT